MDEITILIIEDDEDIRESVKILLENEGFHVIEADNGMDGLHQISEDTDLVILDIMMPGISGIKTCEQIRKISYVPILFLTAKSSENDKIIGFTVGADDYLAKPFNPLEAVARVNSNIRRFYALGTAELSSDILTVRDLELDPEGCVLKKNGEPIELTSVEYRIMELFMKHPGKVFTKQQIYEQGWGDTYVVADNNIMVCISKLRAKLDEDPAAYIRTIRGLGYRLEK